jgi:Arm DNA-binding domain
MPLTELQIKNVKPRPGKTVPLFDARGLYIEISEIGARWWCLKHRYARKEKRLSLGVYPETNSKEARSRCDEARNLLSDGINPSQKRKVDRLVRAERSEDTEMIHTRAGPKFNAADDRSTVCDRQCAKRSQRSPCSRHLFSCARGNARTEVSLGQIFLTLFGLHRECHHQTSQRTTRASLARCFRMKYRRRRESAARERPATGLV